MLFADSFWWSSAFILTLSRRGDGHSGAFSGDSQRRTEMTRSFLAAACIPEELLFSTGAEALRSPPCPPSASSPGLADNIYIYIAGSSAAIPSGTVTFRLWSLRRGPLPGWRCWILTAILLHGGSSGLGPGPQEGLGAELKIRAFHLHTWGFPSRAWAWGCPFHQEQVTSTSRASIPPSVAWGW